MRERNLIVGLRRDLVVGYLSQGYISATFIAAVPLQAAAIGVEGYGLVGVLTALQAWFLLLDFGRTAMLTRASAQVWAHPADAPALRQILLRTERWLVGVAFGGTLLVILLANRAATEWIDSKHLPTAQVVLCLRLMAVVVGLRVLTELHRGVLVGLGQMTWLSGVNALMATLRNVAVLPVLTWGWGEPVVVFFSAQLLLSLIECGAFTFAANNRLKRSRTTSPCTAPHARVTAGPNRRFAWQMSAAALIWVLVSQLDKMLLAGLLPLDQFGVFSLVTVLAGGILLLTTPFGTLVPARLTALGGAQSGAAIHFYRSASRWAATVVGVATALLTLHPGQVLLVWTGDAALAAQAVTLLIYYALGNAVLAMAAFPYYLQFASGSLVLHLKGSLLFATALVPIMGWCALRFGMDGAGLAWLGTNLMYALLWLPLMHRRQAAGLHSQWLWRDTLPPLIGAALGATVAALVPAPASRGPLALWLILVAILAFAGALVCSRLAQEKTIYAAPHPTP